MTRGDGERALEHSERLVRISYPGPSVLALHLRALAATDHCAEARQVVGARGDVYGADCQVGERACSAHLRTVLTDACPGPVAVP